MALYNLKDQKKELPEKTFTKKGIPDPEADESYKKARKEMKKHVIEDMFKESADGKMLKKPDWFFTTEAFHFNRPKGVGRANYDITVIANITLHIMARSLKEAIDIIDADIQGGDSKILSEVIEDINRLLQSKQQIHEQHNLSWIPPFQEEEFLHHIPAGNPATIHVESEDTGFIEYPADIQFMKIWVDDSMKIRVEPERGGPE